jgi:DNA-binding HxlR family transcriptional regulator
VCGQPTAPQLVCGHCRLPTTPRDTVTVLAARASDFMTDSSLRRRRSSKRHEPTDPALLFPETMALIGDRTSALIIALSFLGVRRFRDFARQLEVSPSVLTDRLQRLVRQGVLERRMPASGGHAEYRLTVKGMDFFPVTVELVHWAQRWFGDPAGAAVHITHRACDQPFDPQLACDRCGGLLERSQLRWDAPGPSNRTAAGELEGA